jgi:chromosomal replication initiation ATPase DnaA
MGPELEKKERAPGRTFFDIVEEVCRAWNVEPGALYGRDRHQTVSACRTDVWRHLRALGWSYPKIAKAFHRDSSTVIQVLNTKPSRRAA